MTETLPMNAELRATGSKEAVKVRMQGKMPAVIYGHKQEPVAISLDAKLFNEALQEGHRLFSLSCDGKTETTLLKDLQYDHFHKDVIHVDFVRVDLNEKATVSIPVILKGTAKGISEGGIVDTHSDHIEITCPVTSIPESFDIVITKLGLGESIFAKDIALPNGATLVTTPDTLVVNCHEIEEVEEVEEGEEGAEPEVITEKKQED